MSENFFYRRHLTVFF